MEDSAPGLALTLPPDPNAITDRVARLGKSAAVLASFAAAAQALLDAMDASE